MDLSVLITVANLSSSGTLMDSDGLVLTTCDQPEGQGVGQGTCHVPRVMAVLWKGNGEKLAKPQTGTSRRYEQYGYAPPA